MRGADISSVSDCPKRVKRPPSRTAAIAPSALDISRHLDDLTKPPGSLGRLEELAADLCRIQQTLTPEVGPRRLVVFAADHGVVAEGVSSWPSEVTRSMALNMLAGGAASSAFARTTRTSMEVVDVGIAGHFDPVPPGLIVSKVRAGSRNLAREPALTPAEFDRALEVGREAARRAASGGIRVLAAGEMGIGNTTSAACLTAYIAGLTAAQATGRGAGLDDTRLARKTQIVERAVARAKGLPLGEALAALGGLEIVAIAGMFAEAAGQGLVLILDGYIATAGALIAESLFPGTRERMIAAHRSAEPGHTGALAWLKLSPYLDGWNLRLGEGTGALMLMPMLDLASAMVGEMATFSQAGIAGEKV